ncbi:hypothetical protein BS78_02G396600 [Paspalum vaginatum]|nr:hypothetical protein BS78_02G396600 [Paspalum vaginatum]
MASVRTTILLLLPPVSVLLCMAVLCLCRMAARKLTALAPLPPVEEDAIRGLPVARYRRKQVEEECRCVFCLSGIEEGEEIRELRCRHLFHRACLDRWLLARRPLLATCPLCRARLLAPPPSSVSAVVWPAPPWEVYDLDGEEGEDDTDMTLFMAYVHSRSSWFWPS